MSGWLYLIKNKDLYKIGITKHFNNRMKKLKPDSIILKFYTNDYIKLEKELHNRYKKHRIPQTEYFRLKKIHIKEIKRFISEVDFPFSLIFKIFIKSTLLIFILFLLVFLFISLKINQFNIVMMNSLLVMERISICLSIISVFVNSRNYLNFWNELKFRTTNIIFFIIFSFCFRIVNLYFYLI